MVGIIIMIVAFIVLHFFDKWLIDRGVRRPLVYSIVCCGFCLVGLIAHYTLSGVHNDFVEKMDFANIIFGGNMSVGATISHYLIFISAFMFMPYIPDITWEDKYTEYLNITEKVIRWKEHPTDFYPKSRIDGYKYEITDKYGCVVKSWESDNLEKITDEWDINKESGIVSREIKKMGTVPGLAIKLFFVLGIYAFLFLVVVHGDSVPKGFFSAIFGAVILLAPMCLIEFGIRKLINKMLLKQAEQELNK